MNIALLTHELPRPTDLLFPYIYGSDFASFAPDWIESTTDVFVIVGVDDDQVRQLYIKSNEEVERLQSRLKQFNAENNTTFLFDAQFKRLYRFDSLRTASLFMEYLSSLLRESGTENMDECEEILRDRLESWYLYEEPRTYARELTEQDWLPGGVFYGG